MNCTFNAKFSINKLLRSCIILCLIFTFINNYSYIAYETSNNSSIQENKLEYIDISQTNSNSNLKELSTIRTPKTPTISLEVTSGNLEVNNNAEINFVDIEVSENNNQEQPEIKIATTLNNSNFISLIELRPYDGWELYYPNLKINKVLLPQNINYLKADAITTNHIKTSTLSKNSNEIATISSNNDLYFVDTDNLLTKSFKVSDISSSTPFLAAYLPDYKNSLLILNTSDDGSSAKANSLTYIPDTTSPSKSFKFNNILGDINDQSVSLESYLDTPFYIKYKSNKLQISETEDPSTLIGILYYSHNLQAKSIKEQSDKITNNYPEFKNNPDDINKFLMSFDGFSLFTVKKNFDNTHLHPNSFKHFYFKNLPPEFISENKNFHRHIAGATFFQNPITKRLYLAISTYDTKEINGTTVISKNKATLLKYNSEKGLICSLIDKRKELNLETTFPSLDIIPTRSTMLDKYNSQKIIYLDGVPIDTYQGKIYEMINPLKSNAQNILSPNESSTNLIEIVNNYYYLSNNTKGTPTIDGGAFNNTKSTYYFSRSDVLFAGSTSSTGGCTTNAQCPADLICRQGICTTCETDNHCGSGEKCCYGTCVFGNCCSSANCTNGQACGANHICISACTQKTDCEGFADLKNCFDSTCFKGTCIRQPMCPPSYQCINSACVLPISNTPGPKTEEITNFIPNKDEEIELSESKPTCEDPNSKIPGCKCIKSIQINDCSYCKRALCNTSSVLHDSLSSKKSIRDPAMKPIIEKINCPESSGNFVIKSTNEMTSSLEDNLYSESKLFIFKVNLTQNSFELVKKAEIDTSTLLTDQCTVEVKSAIAGPVSFNKTTNEITIVDTNGVNTAKNYKVDFNLSEDNEDINITEEGGINISAVNDGYITDLAITPAYKRSQYLIFAKASESSPNYKLFILPSLIDTSINTNEQSATGDLGRLNLTNKQPIQSVIIEDENNNSWIDTNPVNIVQEIIKGLAEASPEEILEKELPVVIFPLTNTNSDKSTNELPISSSTLPTDQPQIPLAIPTPAINIPNEQKGPKAGDKNNDDTFSDNDGEKSNTQSQGQPTSTPSLSSTESSGQSTSKGGSKNDDGDSDDDNDDDKSGKKESKGGKKR